MAVLKQSTTYTRMFMLVKSSDHISGLTGATPTVTLSKAGAAFAAAGGAVTEVSSGWYKIALTTTDTNTLGELAFHITAGSADPTDFVDQVTANILGDTLSVNVASWDSTTVGALPTNFSALAITAGGDVTVGTNNDKTGYSLTQAFPTNFSLLSIDGSGNVTLSSNIKKNTAFNDFMFVMTDATTHAPKTALTVTATKSIDGAAFASCTNTVAEVANGTYQINLTAADTNGNRIMYRFTATGADDLNILVITQP